MRISGVQMKRKELRAMTDQIKQQHGVNMIAMPWQFADQIVYEGYEKPKRAARAVKALDDFHDDSLGHRHGKPKAVTHPVYLNLAQRIFVTVPGANSRAVCSKSRSCVTGCVDDMAEGMLGALHEARTSPLVLNPMQKEERLAGDRARRGQEPLRR